MTITGVRFYRLKGRMSVLELARRADINPANIHRMEHGLKPTMSAGLYISVAKALGVTLDELVKDYDSSLLTAGDRPTCWQTVQSPANVIANYRLRENLSLMQLGDLLGLTREGARRVCMRDSVSDKYITRLAEATGMTTSELVDCYAINMEEKAA